MHVHIHTQTDYNNPPAHAQRLILLVSAVIWISTFRHSWQQEKAQLLGRLNEEEARVKSLMTEKEDAKSRLIKVGLFIVTIISCTFNKNNVCTQVQRHRKKKMSDLKNALELSQARQVELQTEKESLK
jgi:aspartate/tyrosine/aromatic aminotransferase